MKTANLFSSMPLLQAPDVAPGILPATPGPAYSTRILFVEDDAGIRGVLPRVLTRAGYRVEAAVDGLAGWNALCGGSYDLLITDLNMPGLTGLELVAKARSARLTLPVILVSGSLDLERTELHPWLNLAATLSKPFTADQLLGTVKEVLRAAGSGRTTGGVRFPVLTEAFNDIQPCRGWGINE
jgi:DNA-binding response OmpR family regulator